MCQLSGHFWTFQSGWNVQEILMCSNFFAVLHEIYEKDSFFQFEFKIMPIFFFNHETYHESQIPILCIVQNFVGLVTD